MGNVAEEEEEGEGEEQVNLPAAMSG